ncbi:Protein flightless-1 [Taenia crassiceps]|uniref:Protein flightless-1 n=1 Tax=Taenia crassiceps TaxID=6207 RepID=A0ABR4QJ78_9CEST
MAFDLALTTNVKWVGTASSWRIVPFSDGSAMRSYVLAPGSLDAQNHPVLFFPDITEGSPPFAVLDSLLHYFLQLHVFAIDRRGYHIEYVVVLRPQGFFQRFASDKFIAGICSDVFFPLHLIDEPKELFGFISSNQVPSSFGGGLSFDISLWVDFQIEIEAFQSAATTLGREIQAFVGDISRLEALAHIPRDLSTFELDNERVDALHRRRRMLLRRLSICESRGVDLRKRLREAGGIAANIGNSEDEDDGDVGLGGGGHEEAVSSLNLPVDRSTQIILVEQYIIQLSETRSKLRKFWIRYTHGLRNLKTLEEFEGRYKKLHPLLSLWQSLIESVSDYLPGHPGAPLLPATSFSDSSLRGLSDTSEETDSAVVMASEEEGLNSDSSNFSSVAVSVIPALKATAAGDPMEGLLTIQARGKEAQACRVSMLGEILDLIALGENIRDKAIAATTSCVPLGGGGQIDKRMSVTSSSSVLARLTFGGRHIDSLMDGDEGEDEECEYDVRDVKEMEDAYESEENVILGPDGSSVELTNEPKEACVESSSSFLPLVRLIPEYVTAHIVSLHQLEVMACTTLDKAVSQLDRLVQLYTEINEARHWISRGNSLLNPLTAENIAEMDPMACEEAIKQLNVFCDSREQNLVLKGNPAQFRKQFSDLLNAEMKVELSQMLRLVEEVEQALKLTVSKLRQQISRSAYPIKALPPSQQHQALGHQNSTAPLSKQASLTREQTSPEIETLEQPSVAVASKRDNEKLYQRALQELLITEANYIRFLEATTQAFSGSSGNPTLPRLPAFVRDNPTLLVVNIPEQLVFHKNYFYPQLLACNGDPLLIQQWAESSWASLVDLYTNYCLNYERATQYAAAFEKDQIHSQWISSYNQYLNLLEAKKLEDGQERGEEEVVNGEDLCKVASLNRVNSCINFENQLSLGGDGGGGVRGAGDENEENLPPTHKNPCGEAMKSTSLCRPLLAYSSRLLEPAQRFQRYHLLIDRLKKYAPEGPQKEALTKAHQSMLDMCNTVNILMRIRGLSDHPSRLGRLLLQDNFTVWCAEGRNNKHQRYVLLFENAILLTKLRQTNNSLVSTVLATLSSSGTSSSQSLTSGVTDSNTEEAGSCANENDSLPSTLPFIPIDASSQKPTYEIKMEIKLTEVGLTPSVPEDRRRFAVWTPCRAQLYTFQPSNLQVRTQWVRAINDLLSAQLKRIRDDVNRQHDIVTCASSSSLKSSCCQRSDTPPDDINAKFDDDADKPVSHLTPSKLADLGECGFKAKLDTTGVTGVNEDECTPQQYSNHNHSHTLSPSSASSEDSSLDLSSGSASPDVQSLIPSLTAKYFVGLFKPSIESLDNTVAAYLLTQGKLKLLLEGISQDLTQVLDQIVPPIDLQQHTREISIANSRLRAIESHLQRIQTRLQALQTRAGTKSVTQFLRGLDLSGVNFGSVGEHVAAQSSDGVARRSKNRAFVSAASAVLPCTHPLEKMTRLEWLKLRNSQLTNSDLPSELKYLNRLEYLSLAKNKLTRLTSITDWPKVFPNLRVLNCRKNQLVSQDAIPPDIFDCPNLQVVDFSCNQLTQVPRGIENASGLLVLNLSNNQLSSVPAEIFTECTELMLLDLSDNCLTVLPAQLRRCSSLQQLVLNRNPFQHYQPRTIVAIKNLEVLHMSGTQRRLDNIPKELDRLTKLADLDLSHNQLVGVPEPVFDLRALRKLDLSHNEISELSALTDNWPSLEYLNLSHNQLVSIPSGLTRLTKLRKLYLNDNQLTFSGLPSGMAKLNDLEVLNASNNKLENIPEGLCRCGRLKRLILSNNELETLPDAIHFLIENLEKFDVENNPKLRFPPKPPALQKGAGLAFYNIDFSLDGQLQMMRGISPEPSEDVKKGKESAARLKRMRRRRLDGGENAVTAAEDTEGSQVVLAGMRHIAGEKDAIMRRRYAEAAQVDEKQVAAKRWKEALTKPDLDYSEIFDEDAGTQLGVEIWVIDEFYPKRFEPEDEEYTREVTEVPKDGGATGNREWRIFYWIGAKASLDKRACVAMHAVNLRNFLGIDGQTQREEQGEESSDFLSLFQGHKITILEGSSGSTGFHVVSCKEAAVRMYRLFGQEKTMYIVSMPVSPTSLDPKFVYLVDGDSCLYLWFGSRSRLLIQTRGRLLAEKIAQKERLNEATISLEHEGRESTEFWAVVMGLWKPAPRPPAVEHQEERPVQAIVDHPKPPTNVQRPPPARDYISADWKLPQPILYDVKLGKGYLELLQVDLPLGQLTRDILNSENVYLVDSGGELFVWMGKKSVRFLRYAGFKLAEELTEMMPRGCFGGAEDTLIDEIVADSSVEQTVTAHKRLPPQPCPEGAENEIFRAQFVGWEPAMAVDFTRTAQSVTARGADPNVILERDQIKTDLRALIAPRETPLPWNKAIQLMNDLNYELIEPLELDADFSQGSPTPSLQQFVILDRKWAPVEPRWFGHFFNKDSYIVIARYWDNELSTDTEDVSRKVEEGTFVSDNVEGGDGEEGEEEEEPTKTVVYFWQGREASELAWLTFNFSLRKDMESRLSRNPNANGRSLSVEFKRVKQQQEDMYFLAHFLRKMVIHSGSYRDRDSAQRLDLVHFYHLRMNGDPIATRCLEVKPTVQTLNSCFSYILRIPKKITGSSMDHVFIWIGKWAHPDDKQILQAICGQIYNKSDTKVEMLSEGEEPEAFWTALGGKGKYDNTADYMQYSRLFRLSNDAGYFHASEKCADFCQDDLVNDDVMMLDNGEQVYLWLGKKTSDVEVKLSLQAAKLYKEHMARSQPSRPRQLKLTAKNAEPFLFRRCFHGWGPFYEPKDWSG